MVGRVVYSGMFMGVRVGTPGLQGDGVGHGSAHVGAPPGLANYVSITYSLFYAQSYSMVFYYTLTFRSVCVNSFICIVDTYFGRMFYSRHMSGNIFIWHR